MLLWYSRMGTDLTPGLFNSTLAIAFIQMLSTLSANVHFMTESVYLTRLMQNRL